MVLIMILIVPVMFVKPASCAVSHDEYISELRTFSGDSEQEVIRKLRAAGYEPVMENIANDRPELNSPFVYVGYKTTTDPDESVEGRETENTGSVFGDASLMIAGVAMILGVAVGMISMKIKPKTSPSKK